MATQDISTVLTLVELAKRTNDNDIMTIVEVLAEDNEMVQDAVWLPSNQIVSNVTSQRVSLPSGTWRKINKGVSKQASSTKQIVDSIGRCEAYSYVDKFLYDIAPNKKAFRTSEDMAFVEGLSQTLADALIYGDTDDEPEKFDGFLSSGRQYTALSDGNVWSAGGSGGSHASVLAIQWGPRACHCLYPRNMENAAGVKHEDRGQQTVEDADGNPYEALVSLFSINGGLSIKNPRCFQRVCNLETTGVTNNFLDGSAEDALIKALNHMPRRGRGAIVYVNETIQSQIDIRAKDRTNVNYHIGTEYGAPITYFRGHPIHRADALTITEAAVA